ncbi:glycosyltransferase family 4 protein [Nocardioides cynanchi]|uniref:glycosyltransferase family 4 protein n=1 Tax=Nocardioides cynanchi TaxID=2558918 RepID=UPI001247D028|nr:glycosyltransferase family 4 protein [Nocardioides cynanchi]
MTAETPQSTGRRSLGGRVVEDSLARVGYSFRPAVQLVETARPRLRRAEVVLVQNAWNFLPAVEFRELARPYPSPMRRRMEQRRLLARLNTRRAERIVALTTPMAELAGRSTGRPVEVSEVLYPLSLLDPADDHTGLPDEPFVLVPGTLTWYKDPVLALTVVAARPDLPRRVVLAGPDDGSGCWTEIQRVASTLGLRVTGGPVTAAVMRTALRRADAVIVGSRLESLGFSLTEALALAPGRVLASPLASHVTLAERVGRLPEWLGQEPSGSSGAGLPSPPDPADLEASWDRLGTCLGLLRTGEAS